MPHSAAAAAASATAAAGARGAAPAAAIGALGALGKGSQQGNAGSTFAPFAPTTLSLDLPQVWLDLHLYCNTPDDNDQTNHAHSYDVAARTLFFTDRICPDSELNAKEACRVCLKIQNLKSQLKVNQWL